MEKSLLKKLEVLREKMNQLAVEKGLSHHQVLILSQEIDGIHNKINELKAYRSAAGSKHDEVKERSSTPYVYQHTSYSFFSEWSRWKKNYLTNGAML